MEWIAVSEIMPNKGYCFAAWEWMGEPGTGEVWYDDVYGWMFPFYGGDKDAGYDDDLPIISHYMPLPSHPALSKR